MSPKAEGGFVETFTNPPEAWGDIWSLISRYVMVLVFGKIAQVDPINMAAGNIFAFTFGTVEAQSILF